MYVTNNSTNLTDWPFYIYVQVIMKNKRNYKAFNQIIFINLKFRNKNLLNKIYQNLLKL